MSEICSKLTIKTPERHLEHFCENLLQKEELY